MEHLKLRENGYTVHMSVIGYSVWDAFYWNDMIIHVYHASVRLLRSTAQLFEAAF